MRRFLTKTTYILLAMSLVCFVILRKDYNLSSNEWNENGTVHFEKRTSPCQLVKLNEPLLVSADVYKNMQCQIIWHTSLKINICDKGSRFRPINYYANGEVWPKEALELFLTHLYVDDGLLAIDVGASTGAFTFFAWRMSRRVLAIESSASKIASIHKAAQMQHAYDGDITLLHGLVSNRSGEMLSTDSAETVTAIVLDELVQTLPLTTRNDMYKRAIIRVNSAEFEMSAFRHAEKLFTRLQIQAILIGRHLTSRFLVANERLQALEMIQFLERFGLFPFSYNGSQLNVADLESWPSDVFWRLV